MGYIACDSDLQYEAVTFLIKEWSEAWVYFLEYALYLSARAPSQIILRSSFLEQKIGIILSDFDFFIVEIQDIPIAQPKSLSHSLRVQRNMIWRIGYVQHFQFSFRKFFRWCYYIFYVLASSNNTWNLCWCVRKSYKLWAHYYHKNKLVEEVFRFPTANDQCVFLWSLIRRNPSLGLSFVYFRVAKIFRRNGNRYVLLKFLDSIFPIALIIRWRPYLQINFCSPTNSNISRDSLNSLLNKTEQVIVN